MMLSFGQCALCHMFSCRSPIPKHCITHIGLIVHDINLGEAMMQVIEKHALELAWIQNTFGIFSVNVISSDMHLSPWKFLPRP